MLKKIFSSDYRKALERARDDERNKANQEWDDKMKDALEKQNGKHEIEKQELLAEIDSILIRYKELKAKEKQLEIDRHKVNDQYVKLKHIISTMHYFAEKDRLDRAEREAVIQRMNSELLGFDK